MTTVNEFTIGQRVQILAQGTRGVDDQRLARDDRCTSRLHGGISGDLNLPCHFRRPICRLRYSGGDTGEHGACGRLGVDRVTLAVVAPLTPVAVTHFDDTDGVPADETRQANAIRAGALDANGLDGPQPTRPVHQHGIAGAIRRDRAGREFGTHTIDRDGDVDVLMGIAADDDRGQR